VMKLSIVLSTHAAQFQAVAFKGDFEGNVARIASYGYHGVELAIRDPQLVNADELEAVVAGHGLAVPAIGTGQAWGEERLSFTSDDPAVRRAAVARVKSHVPLARRFGAVIILGLIRGITPSGQSHEQSMPTWWRPCKTARLWRPRKGCASRWNRSTAMRRTSSIRWTRD